MNEKIIEKDNWWEGKVVLNNKDFDNRDKMIFENCKKQIAKAKKEATDQSKKEELEWLEICYKRFPHNFVKERILWLKEKNG